MTHLKRVSFLVAGSLLVAAPHLSPAKAQAFDDLDPYVSFSAGASFLRDSDNDGAFVGDFETGEGTTIAAGTILPDGTPVGWTTEFDTGYALAAAAGVTLLPNIRGELEIAFQSNNVETHNGVVAGGIPLAGEDAAVLITGASALGISVGDLVADGQGSVDTLFVMANGYYDFGDESWYLRPYVGAGIGIGFVDVDYSPSNTVIVDDDQTAFAYQAMAGVTAQVSPMIDVFGGYRYRATTDVETDVSLFNASLDIENEAHILEGGIRFKFN
ncbi:MAG: outer membrane protein [Alphaproteobacteria bacterium]